MTVMGKARSVAQPVEPDSAALVVRDLRMRYGTNDVLNGVNFAAARGEVLALLGPNGAGKTTTIEILEGFRMRSAGEVSVLGVDPARGDEPTAGFDPEARREFHELVHRLSDDEDTTILLTTHDLDEAEKLSDRILILAGGAIIADGSPDALSRQMATETEVKWTLDGQRFVHSTAEATEFVHRLFLQHGEAIADLEVRRGGLEDVYM